MTTTAALKERLRSRAVAMYKAGEPTTKIADWAGVHPTTVLVWVRKAGASRPAANPHANHDENVRAAVLADLRTYEPLRKIAKQHGVPEETVIRWRNAAGIPRRSVVMRARFDREYVANPNATVSELAELTGIPKPTLRTWLKEAAVPEAECAYHGRWIQRGGILIPTHPRNCEAA